MKLNKFFIGFLLVAVFFLVLFFNSYFNYTSNIAYNPEGTTLGTKFFLSGPDPYYNMRLCQITMETGQYPFVALSDGDPLLNYPVGVYAGARPPLFNLIAVNSANFLSNFMPAMDALGWCMLFLPAIYGALLVFPVYGIGKELFGKKIGLIAALLIPLIPAHIASGHGSSLSLFDHDSFLLLLFTCSFFFILKMLKSKEMTKSILYALCAGVCFACVELTWAVSQTLFLMSGIFVVVLMIFDIVKHMDKSKLKNPLLFSIIFGSAYLISLPYNIMIDRPMTYLLYLCLMSLGIFAIYYVLYKFKMPWIISIPGLAVLAGIGVGVIYLVHLQIIQLGAVFEELSLVIFGEGIYGSQVALTIGEAHTYGLSQTVMSIGPALYWVGLVGLILFIYRANKNKWQSYELFFIVIFFIQLWFTTIAGRFLNDIIPLICVFSGFVIWTVVEKANFKQMTIGLKHVGLRRMNKAIKLTHIFVIFFLAFLIIMPNTYLSLNSAVPANMRDEMGLDDSAGLSIGQEAYWADACYWLSQQDTNIPNDGDKPGVITWWDYGFYLSSMSEHPTVADNYQEGLECAGNFHTAQTEQEAVAVLVVRLVEATKVPKKQIVGIIPQEIKDIFTKYFGNESVNLTAIIENPYNAPSYNQLIAPEYGNTFLRIDTLNAMYHDATKIILTLSDKDLTLLHHEMMKATGYQIRYYGIEQRDMYSIFGVFPFLADKSTVGYSTLEDDWYRIIYVDTNTNKIYTEAQLNNMTEEERSKMSLTSSQERKPAFFNSIAFRVFFGFTENGEIPDRRIPAYLLSHWKAVYISPYISIAKYYEGANVTGTVKVGTMGYDGTAVAIMDENGIPHDLDVVENGVFSLIAPAGNVSVSLLVEQTILKTEFLANISEEEATWQKDSSYVINLSVNLSSANIAIFGLNETSLLNVSSIIYPDFKKSFAVNDGNFFIDNLVASTYKFEVIDSTGNITYTKNQFLYPDNNQVNLTIGG